MKGIKCYAALGAVLAAAVISGFAPAAQAAPTASAGPAAHARMAPAFSGREVYRIDHLMPGPRHARVRASGAFSAKGVFIRRDAELRFRKGKIIVIRQLSHTTYIGPNLATCRFRILQSGTFRVTRATGRFRGLHESGTFSTTLRARLKRTGPDRCGHRIVHLQAIIVETGTLS
jgi:hypothetical protein